MAVNSVDYTKTLTGQLLVATPQMTDPRFQKRALLICQHDETAAMGFIINQPSEEVTISSLSDQLEIDQPRFEPNAPVYIGGPVEPQRGYILHTDDQMMPNSVLVRDNICLSMHVDMITEITRGLGPMHAKILLGYAGWSAGQLEEEMKQSMWFHLPATADMLFNTEDAHIWDKTFRAMGFNAGSLSPQSGSA